MLWSDFQQVAERYVRGPTEADWPSAISRSYYAAFHYFREFYRANGVAVGKGGQSHFDLPSGLIHCGLLIVAPFGRRLEDLRGERTTADYDLGKSINQAYAQTIVKSGRTLIADFQTLLGTVPAPQIAAGAKRYLKSIGHIP
jgi:hypothetical protein